MKKMVWLEKYNLDDVSFAFPCNFRPIYTIIFLYIEFGGCTFVFFSSL